MNTAPVLNTVLSVLCYLSKNVHRLEELLLFPLFDSCSIRQKDYHRLRGEIPEILWIPQRVWLLLSAFPLLLVDSSGAEEWSRAMPLITHLVSFSGSRLIAADISLFKQRNEGTRLPRQLYEFRIFVVENGLILEEIWSPFIVTMKTFVFSEFDIV